MKPITHIRLRGLVTGRGLLGAPEGALQVADDVTSLLPGTIEPRKGYRELQAQVAGTTAPDPSDASGVAYGDGQVVQLRKQGADHVLALHDPGAGTSSLSAQVTLHPEGGVPMRSMGRRAYACTGAGVMRVEDGVVREAGIPRALDINRVFVGPIAGGIMSAGDSVRYRVVYGDGTNWGAPSGPGSLTVPDSLTDDYNPRVEFSPDPSDYPWWSAGLIVRVYRSEITPSGIEPSDELFLVYEGPLPEPDMFGRRNFDDSTPNEFLGPPLYTNAETGDGFGAAGANDPPPLVCSDVASWEARNWYAIHADNEPWMVQVVGVDGFGDYVDLVSFDADGNIVGTVSLEAVNGSPTDPWQFQVFTSGTPSHNVWNTAGSLRRAMCWAPGSPVLAWYVSGPNDPPGMIAVRLRPEAIAAGVVRVAMSVQDTETSAMPEMFSPRLPYVTVAPTPGDAQILLDDSKPGRLRWSKPGLPEAVPPINELPVGDAREPIIGMVALRDGIVVAKTDGLYLVYGSGGMYGVQLIDASVRMSPSARRGGRGTIQELNNEVFLHANDQHVYACSASGARAVDTDIQDLLRHRDALFAAVDERDGLYCLYMRDTYRVGLAMTDVAVYSMHARAWTRWLTAHFWASQWTSGGLVACSNADVLSVTRNAGTVEDYQDDGPTSSVQFLASDDGGRTQMLDADSGPTAVSGATFGDEVFLVSDPTIRGTVLFQRPGDTSQRLLLHGLPFPDGSLESVRVAKCIRARVMLAPWHGGSPGGRKRFSFAQMHFDRYGLQRVGDGVERASLGGLGYQTPWVQTQGADGDDGQKNILVSDLDLSWAEINGPWSTMYETPIQPRTVRFAVPKQDQSAGMLSVGLSTKQVNGFWRLAGVTIEMEQGDQKVAR